MTWDPAELDAIAAAQELEIATTRADGTARGWTPIWVVVADGQAFVRTWHRRSTGWYGDALARPRARIRVPGLETEVAIEDVGTAKRTPIDAAYGGKYGEGQMSDDGTAASTLRLDRASSVTFEG